MQDWPGLIEAYRSWLPVSDKTPVISLREGATPLIPAPVIAERIGRGVKVYLKYDGLNPTMLQNEAGFRSEPPMSDPSAIETIPVAKATAAPPLDPPHVTVRS